MKVFSAQQIREWDEFTIKDEKIDSFELMERAARACTLKLLKRYTEEEEFVVVCGKGNNGGDGLAIARLLFERKRKVKVFIAEIFKNESEDFKINLKKLQELEKVKIIHIKSAEEFEVKERNTLLIDCLLGTGIKHSAKGELGEIIRKINKTGLRIISIDIPSGLHCDVPFDEKHPGEIICSDLTLSFQQPKLSFFFAENEKYVPEYEIIDLQLNNIYHNKTGTRFHYLETEEFSPFITKPNKFSHKGTNGHALLISGSKGKMGACIMASRGFLKCGGGLLSTLIPAHGNTIMQSMVPEAMTISDNASDYISHKIDFLTYSAIAIGPGLGTEKETARVLKVLIQDSIQPLVLDADALNILSENKTWVSFLKPNTILTPHPKEFDRLFGTHTSSFERMQTATEKSIKHNLIIVLKGAHTSIHIPDGQVFFNSSGNPGMAKGGFGDVLCGMLLSLLCKGYSPVFSACLAVYLHGSSGDIALKKSHYFSLQPEDLIQKIPKAWQKLN